MAIDVVNSTVLRRWTAAEEAQLQELMDRRKEIMDEGRTRLFKALDAAAPPDIANRGLVIGKLTDALIPVADVIIHALRPFSRD